MDAYQLRHVGPLQVALGQTAARALQRFSIACCDAVTSSRLRGCLKTTPYSSPSGRYGSNCATTFTALRAPEGIPAMWMVRVSRLGPRPAMVNQARWSRRYPFPSRLSEGEYEFSQGYTKTRDVKAI
jgi:hypothetical protein